MSKPVYADPNYQENRRKRLRAAGKCVDCQDPSETYRCLPCRKVRSFKKFTLNPNRRQYPRLFEKAA